MRNLLYRWVCSVPYHDFTLKTASVLNCTEQLQDFKKSNIRKIEKDCIKEYTDLPKVRNKF